MSLVENRLDKAGRLEGRGDSGRIGRREPNPFQGLTRTTCDDQLERTEVYNHSS